MNSDSVVGSTVFPAIVDESGISAVIVADGPGRRVGQVWDGRLGGADHLPANSSSTEAAKSGTMIS